MTPRDLVYLGHMLDTAKKAVSKTEGLSRDAYDADENLRLALIHLIQVIGEAGRQVSREFSDHHPEVPWADIIGMRHKVVHDYLGVDVSLPIAFDGLGRLEVDLLCADARVAVELDGAQHLADPVAYRRDRRKDQVLQENGYLVLRFLAEDVGKELDLVLDAIVRAFSSRRATAPPVALLTLARGGRT